MDWLVLAIMILMIWFFAGIMVEIMLEEDEIPELYRYK
jgi:hypothetical protein